MKKSKRSLWLGLLLSAVLTLGLLAGCGRGNGQENSGAQHSAVSAAGQTQQYTGEDDRDDVYAEDDQDDVYAEDDQDDVYIDDDQDDPYAGGEVQVRPDEKDEQAQKPAIDENGSYTSKDDVALYIHTYGKLPSNFITKKEAQKLGWSGGSLEPYAPGKCIGGSHFGNYEGILPDGNYRECDIDTLGKKSRGSKRIIYSDDGRIYYTKDHYKSFEQLY